MDKLIELRKDIGDKEKSIAGYKKRDDLKKEKKDASEMFENTQNLILAGIQNQLNNEILLLNEKIEGKKNRLRCSLFLLKLIHTNVLMIVEPGQIIRIL